MKAYGKKRHECANRKRRGTSMACPCCIPRTTHMRSQTRVYKKRELIHDLEDILNNGW